MSKELPVADTGVSQLGSGLGFLGREKVHKLVKFWDEAFLAFALARQSSRC